MKARRKLETPKYEEAQALKIATDACMFHTFLRLVMVVNREMVILKVLDFPWIVGHVNKPRRRYDATEA